MNWGVCAYNEWHEERLRTFNYDYSIYNADLNSLQTLKKDEFEHAMIRFVPEVTKCKGVGPYLGQTLYQLCGAIEKYLNVNKIYWKLTHQKTEEFQDLCTVLDNVMKERTAENVGTVKKQSEVIAYEYENELWSKGILGEGTSDQLCNTVLFMIGMNCVFRAGDEHYYLRHDMP